MRKFWKSLSFGFLTCSLLFGINVSKNYDPRPVNAATTYTATISKYNSSSYTLAVSDGSLIFGTSNSNIKKVDGNGGTALFTVSFLKNSSTATIFNNSAGEIRLYPYNTTGGKLTFSIQGTYKITSFQVLSTANKGASINGGTTFTDLNKTETFSTTTTTVTLQNTFNGTSNGTFQVSSVVISYESTSTKTLSSISTSGTPSKTQYFEGESFIVDGVTITAHYSDSTAADVTSSCTFTPSPLTSGLTSVTASYTEGTTETTPISGITVLGLSSIAVSGTPTKTTYFSGETFAPAGITVTATYSDLSTSDVTSSCTYSPTPLTVETTSVTVSYTLGTTTKTSSVSGLTVIDLNPQDYPINVFSKYSGSGDSSSSLAENTSIIEVFTQNIPSILSSAVVKIDSSDTVTRVFYAGTSNTKNGFQPLKLGSGSGYGNILLTFDSKVKVTSVKLYAARYSTSGTSVSMQVNSASAQNIGTAGVSDSTFNSYTFSGNFLNTLTIRTTTKVAAYLYGLDIEYSLPVSEYAASFLSATDVCDGSGNINNITPTIWANQKAAFLLLDTQYRDILKNTSAGTADDAQKCIARYTFIVEKYGTGTFENFMNVSLSPLGNPGTVSTIKSSDSSLLTVIIISSLGLTSVLAYSLGKKKEEQA